MHLPNYQMLQAYSSALLKSAKSTLLCATVHMSNQNGVLHCAIRLLSRLLDQQVISGYLCEYMSQLKRIHTLSLAERVLRSEHAFEIPFFSLKSREKLNRYQLTSLLHPSHICSTEAVSSSQHQLFPQHLRAAFAPPAWCSPNTEETIWSVGSSYPR